MTSFACRNGDFLPKLGRFIEICGVVLFHTHGTASTADIPGQWKQILYGDELHILIAGSLGCFFQVQLTANGNTEHMNSGTFPSGDQRFENHFMGQSQSIRCVSATKIGFIIIIKSFPAGNSRLNHKPNSIGFGAHKITPVIIQQNISICKYEL